MKSKCILDEFEELSLKKNITKEELMIILKKYASTISVHDLMIASAHLRKEGNMFRQIIVKNSLKYIIDHSL